MNRKTLRIKLKRGGRICPRSKYAYWERNQRDWKEIQLGGVAEIEAEDEKSFFKENPDLEATKDPLTGLFEEEREKLLRKQGKFKEKPAKEERKKVEVKHGT